MQLIVLLTILLLPSVRLSAQSSICEINEPLTLTTDRERADGLFLEALRQQYIGNTTESYELLQAAHHLNPDNVGVIFELVNFARSMNNDSLALSGLKRAAELDSANFWIKNALFQQYLEQNDYQLALSELESLTQQYPKRSDLLRMLAALYSQNNDYEGIIRTLSRIEVLEGKSETLSMQKFRTYRDMNDEQRAFDEMTALADEYPNDPRYRTIIGDLYLENDKLDEAYRIYTEMLTKHPDSPVVLLSMANYYQVTGQESQADSLINVIVVNTALDDKVRLTLAKSMVYDNVQQNADTTQMMHILRRLVDLPQQDTELYTLAVSYMITSDAPVSSVKPVLHKILELEPETEMARNQLLSYAIEEEDTAEIVRLCRTAVDYGSTNAVYSYYLSVALYQQNKFQESIDAARRALDQTDQSGNIELVSITYALLGDLYHRTGRDELAFAAYDSCLIYKPDYALVLNNYAYYLSLRHKDLDHAAEMSLRSLQTEGNNPTYLDTYAWILFQQRRYDEARAVIDSVLVILGDSVTSDDVSLIEHAGDIYSRCGQTGRAVEYWQKALELGGDNALIEKKIRKRKYLEK